MPRVTITIADRNPQPYRFQLDRMKVNMGRGSDNDIVIDDGSASVTHAVMERIDGGYQLRDLGSTNGIKLDGERRDIIPLRHGLTVKIGDVAFDFTLTEEEREALAREKPAQESPIVREDSVKSLPKPAGGPARPAPAPAARQVIYETQPSASASFFMTLFFLVLAAGAFWLGLSFRYSARHQGGSLMHDLQKSAAGLPVTPPGAKPAEAAPAADPAPAPAEPAK
ncbi:FHA domain-containing protein [Luteolibacter sp. GHJ8]|uniref:FHA domain-containing protein n=1 Tax=Luteolibacter rhizosphaerae TaxID=2989719 RepID=A0ABT3G1G1_9BACT|nr:FHA domain-containing protein [Luteolibacter rhizosphaerae]MCW1913665.1 FHA domain-containing protein [Luteolibacter rhizosphaerae]